MIRPGGDAMENSHVTPNSFDVAAWWEGAVLTPMPMQPALNLRVRGESAIHRAAAVLGISTLPAVNRMLNTEEGALVAWLRPDEWLVMGDDLPADGLVVAVGDDGAVVDTTAARSGYTLSGLHARDVLSTCCPLDVHESALGPGHCAQTLIGNVAVFLAPQGQHRFIVMTRPSTADYVARWLVDGIVSIRLQRDA
jgi:sarcosine oxidase, subunit gamma